MTERRCSGGAERRLAVPWRAAGHFPSSVIWADLSGDAGELAPNGPLPGDGTVWWSYGKSGLAPMYGGTCGHMAPDIVECYDFVNAVSFVDGRRQLVIRLWAQ